MASLVSLIEESVVERTYLLKISPNPSLPSGPEALWAGGQRGEFLPFAKGGKEGFSFRYLYNYGLISNYRRARQIL